MKICRMCNIEKSKLEFLKSNTSKDGFNSYCKRCDVLRKKKHRRTKKGLITHIYASQKRRCVKRNDNLPTYSNQELQDWCLSQIIFHTLHKIWIDGNYEKNLVPSIDRLDDYKSYTLDNIQLMSWEEHNKKSKNDVLNGKNLKHSKTVMQFSVDDIFIREYYSAGKAHRETGINYDSITRCCRRGITAGGFKWKYK